MTFFFVPNRDIKIYFIFFTNLAFYENSFFLSRIANPFWGGVYKKINATTRDDTTRENCYPFCHDYFFHFFISFNNDP